MRRRASAGDEPQALEAAIRAYEQKFIGGARTRGAAPEVAERVWSQIVGFSGFGFPKAHSAAFGLLAYQSTWLRVHYGPEFLCSLLNEQPMGFYPPDTLVHEAQRRRIEVLPPCVVRSGADCRVETAEAATPATPAKPAAPAQTAAPQTAAPAKAAAPADADSLKGLVPHRAPNPSTVGLGHALAVRLGLGYVSGAREREVRALVYERERGGAWRSLGDLAGRSGAFSETLGRLAWAGACDELVDGAPGSRRRRALWELGVAVPGEAVAEGTQLALPLEPHAGPELRMLSAWSGCWPTTARPG